MRATRPHAEFAPPRTGGQLPALALAIAAHVFLLLALTAGVTWQHQEQTAGLTVQAELWASVPRLGSPTPPSHPAPPPPEPLPAPPQVRTAPQPQPEPPPDTTRRDADIARERQQAAAKAQAAAQQQHEREQRALLQKQAAEKKRADDEAALQAEKLRQQTLNLKQQAEAQALADATAQQKKLALIAQKKLDQQEQRKQAQKKAADEKKQAEEEQQQSDTRHKQALARLTQMAGVDSGSPSGGGTSNGSGGKTAGDGRGLSMSPSYGAKVSAKLRPNIVYTDEIVGNLETVIEVRATVDGTILSRKIVKSSGNKAWDEAVINAIDKTDKLPPDADGRIPTYGTIKFRPRD